MSSLSKQEENRRWKRRRTILEQLLKHYFEWRVLFEEEGVDTLSHDGEDYGLHDIMENLDLLPPRQLEAVQLICILNFTQKEAAEIMGFTKWTTPVQQYKNAGLGKLLTYMDDPELAREKREQQRAKKARQLRKKAKEKVRV